MSGEAEQETIKSELKIIDVSPLTANPGMVKVAVPSEEEVNVLSTTPFIVSPEPPTVPKLVFKSTVVPSGTKFPCPSLTVIVKLAVFPVETVVWSADIVAEKLTLGLIVICPELSVIALT